MRNNYITSGIIKRNAGISLPNGNREEGLMCLLFVTLFYDEDIYIAGDCIKTRRRYPIFVGAGLKIQTANWGIRMYG